jgi:hypothetical protein
VINAIAREMALISDLSAIDRPASAASPAPERARLPSRRAAA